MEIVESGVIRSLSAVEWSQFSLQLGSQVSSSGNTYLQIHRLGLQTDDRMEYGVFAARSIAGRSQAVHEGSHGQVQRPGIHFLSHRHFQIIFWKI